MPQQLRRRRLSLPKRPLEATVAATSSTSLLALLRLLPLAVLLPLSLPTRAAAVGRVVPILHGWHLELLMYNTRKDRPAAVIALGTTDGQCKPGWDWAKHDLREVGDLPSRASLFIGQFDRSSLSEIWWSVSDADWTRYDLFTRFNVTHCPSYIFFPAATDVSDPSLGLSGVTDHGVQVWDMHQGDPPWRQWLNQRLLINTTLSNTMPYPVKIKVASQATGKYFDDVGVLEAGETRQLSVPTEGVLEAMSLDSGDTFWHHLVPVCVSEEDCQTLLIHGRSDGYEQMNEESQRLSRRAGALNDWDQGTTFLQAANLRQPPMMSDFKEQNMGSYKIADMPSELYRRLKDLYKRYESRRTVEEHFRAGSAINYEFANTSLVSLENDPHEKHLLGSQFIQPLIEEWVGMPLEFTSFYGIREYYRGSELRMHVDRVSSHVFSAILNVAQEGMDADWDLEVIDFDGVHKSVSMKPGQMIYYQSAKLIHGRPTALRGDLYASCFCHFKPVENWGYHMFDDVLHLGDTPVVNYKVD
eukprot:TRINITY_DN31988_c0_g1_i1.p1 TRINITY_DN31988_c0_g1~~TRINITY_DN31988_c0_g1_i1.p1  ORF type:complete len:548 (+),score=75.32 TRINITY_DN31988_c0_g1_i1:62-1645(+)